MSERVRIAVPVTTLWRDPAAVRPIDEAIIRTWPEPAIWLRALDVPDRRDLVDRADSQALLGEEAELSEEHHGWARVSLVEQPAGPQGHGYQGWLPSAHLESAGPDGAETRVVSRRLTGLRDAPGGRVFTLLSLGSRFAVIDRSADEVALRLAGGRVGWARLDATEPEGARPAWGEKAAAVIRRSVLDGAELFLGVPYLWGGLSGYGVDCSGLVHLSCRMAGIRIPRDADDQAAAPAVGSSPDATVAGNAGPGWLVYFATSPETGEGVHHVGVAVDDRFMMHAPGSGRVVELARYREAPYAKEWCRSRDPVEFPTSSPQPIK